MTFETVYENNTWTTESNASAISAAFLQGSAVIVHLAYNEKDVYVQMLGYVPENGNGDEVFLFEKPVSMGDSSEFPSITGSAVDSETGKLVFEEAVEPV